MSCRFSDFSRTRARSPDRPVARRMPMQPGLRLTTNPRDAQAPITNSWLSAWSPARVLTILLAVLSGWLTATPELFAQVAKTGFSAVHFRNIQPGVEYVGSEACRACHADIYTAFNKTDMGRSMSLASLAS